MEEDDGLVFDVPLRKILRWVDPLAEPPWVGVRGPITFKEIETAIASGDLIPTPVDHGRYHARIQNGEHPEQAADDERRMHIARIAWMVCNPQEDPICIDVGVPHLGNLGHPLAYPQVCDGHHRIAAAIYRDDPSVPVSPSGSLSEARRFFGRKSQRPQSEATSPGFAR